MRANADVVRAATVLKNLYGHKRPFQLEDAPVCLNERGRAALEKSPDYPSGHTTAAWETGMLLMELLPGRGTAILARARAFGESRIVCGVHNMSAVEAGRLTATVVFAAQNASSDFRADVEAARQELTKLLSGSNPSPQQCSAVRSAN